MLETAGRSSGPFSFHEALFCLRKEAPMFWMVILAMGLVWAVGTNFGITVGGFIHILPILAIVFVIVRRMGASPNTEFGRWRSGR